MNDTSTQATRSIRDVREQVESLFADWVQIVDDKSKLTIEDFSYNTEVPDQVEGHCWRCITVNHCWFVNQDDKKPEEIVYNGSLAEVALENRGVYHPNCHCKKFAIGNPQVSDIKLINLTGKIAFVWKDKAGLYEQWGYSDNEKDAFTEMLLQKTKENYVAGNYEIEKHTRNGVKINCIFTIPDKDPNHGGEIEMWSKWMIFPDGTLKCNTMIEGWTR